MGLLELQICAQLDNVNKLYLPPGEDWHFKVKCTACNEENPNIIYFNLVQQSEIEGSRGTANYVAKCSFCKKHGNIVYIENSHKPYTNSEEFQTIAKFECRGVELTSFEPGNGFHAESTASSKEFDDIDLSDKDWAGYDDDGDASCGVYDIKSKVISGGSGGGKKGKK